MKLCEILVSEIPLTIDNFKFGEFTLEAYGKGIVPQRLIIRYDRPFISAPVAPRISGLLSIALSRRVATCNSGFRQAMPQICGKNKTKSLFKKERNLRFRPLDLGRLQLDKKEQEARLDIFKSLHNKLGSLTLENQQVPLKAIEIYQLSRWTQAESPDLAYALLVVAIETMANDKRFVKLDATWKNYGRKDEWERFFEDEHVIQTSQIK